VAGRVSFQKRQKEAARKEKRQGKIERRQGRAAPPVRGLSDADTETGSTDNELDFRESGECETDQNPKSSFSGN
jgi:hypothetical protein